MSVTSAIIPASGLGRRLNSLRDKAFADLARQPLLAHTLAVFQSCTEIGDIVLVVRSEQIEKAKSLAHERSFTKVSAVVAGGDIRQDSVRNGLASVSPETDIIVIHDGARPLVTPEIIAASIETARENGAGVTVVPVIDTIKSSDDGRFVSSTLDRENLYAVQTPQTFRRDIIESAYERAYADGCVGTDDASLVERIGLPVRLVEGSYDNIKITTPTDLSLAEEIMRKRNHADSVSGLPRVGHGYDVHRFAEGRTLFLGGVEFPGERGLVSHSDGDVILHAVADAVLGAVGAGDIGRHFPDTDPTFKDIRSSVLLSRVAEIVADRGWSVGNVDVTLIGERPKIARRAAEMCACIADALGIDPARVSVKASTAEGLGPIGEGLGIECHAVAILYPKR